MTKPQEYDWHIVRVYGGDASGAFQARKLGTLRAPSWIEALHRASEEYGVSYGGLTAVPAH